MSSSVLFFVYVIALLLTVASLYFYIKQKYIVTFILFISGGNLLFFQKIFSLPNTDGKTYLSTMLLPNYSFDGGDLTQIFTFAAFIFFVPVVMTIFYILFDKQLISNK